MGFFLNRGSEFLTKPQIIYIDVQNTLQRVYIYISSLLSVGHFCYELHAPSIFLPGLSLPHRNEKGLRSEGHIDVCSLPRVDLKYELRKTHF